MSTQHEAIVEAFKALGGIRTIDEIRDWVEKKSGARWKDFGTRMADMVPQEFGGNPSSNVPNEFRVLARVAQGKYRLTENRIVQEKDTSNISHEVHISTRTTEEFQPSSKSVFYAVLPSINSVEVWSTERLPFEPKGLLKRLRTDICSAVKGIRCGFEQILHATYVSPIRARCDVENILFYNVGTACFHQVDKAGLRFERVFSRYQHNLNR